ncbi:MAG: hypothetical protein ABJA98_01625 [Acidobacteriota bacterium]
MLKFRITIGADWLDIEGPVPLTDALALIDRWFEALSRADQHRVDHLTRRLAAANTKLRLDVAAATPS